MIYEQFRLRGLIGATLIDERGKQLGKITDFEQEGWRLWATINDDHSVQVHKLEEVMCLTDGARFCRAVVL